MSLARGGSMRVLLEPTGEELPESLRRVSPRLELSDEAGRMLLGEESKCVGLTLTGRRMNAL